MKGSDSDTMGKDGPIDRTEICVAGGGETIWQFRPGRAQNDKPSQPEELAEDMQLKRCSFPLLWFNYCFLSTRERITSMAYSKPVLGSLTVKLFSRNSKKIFLSNIGTQGANTKVLADKQQQGHQDFGFLLLNSVAQMQCQLVCTNFSLYVSILVSQSKPYNR